MDLTQAQWKAVEKFLRPKKRLEKRGRPHQDLRAVVNGILWILRTGAPWPDLPPRYPPYPTCHRWFQRWQQDGVLDRLVEALAGDLQDRGKVDLRECFMDATFAAAKKWALELVRRSAAKGLKSWQLQTAMVFLSPCTWPALHHMSANWSKPRSNNDS